MEQYAYLIAGVAFVLALGVIVYIVQVKQNTSSGQHRPWFHYVLLWPIVLDVDKAKRGGRIFTSRELIGWGIVMALIVGAILFT